MRRPRVALAVLAALAREALLVRPREGLHGLRLADLVLFDIRETRDLEAGDERRAVGLVGLDKTCVESNSELGLLDAIAGGQWKA